MSDIYCPSCGFKNTYTLDRPNFCSSCGSSFSVASSPSPKIKKTEVNLDPDGSDVTEVPDIKGLDFDVSYEGLGKIHSGRDFFEGQNKLEEQLNPKSEKRKTKRKRK